MGHQGSWNRIRFQQKLAIKLFDAGILYMKWVNAGDISRRARGTQNNKSILRRVMYVCM